MSSTKAGFSVGFDELKSQKLNLWKSLVGEFVGNLILNFFATGACTQPEDGTFKALSFGLAIFAAITAVGHISGGHINPAVTIAMMCSGRISLIRSALYIVVQCLGSAAGTCAVKALVDEVYHNGLAHNSLAEGITGWQGFGIEFFLGLVLVLTVFGACDANKPDSRYTAPLAIGMTVTLGHLGTLRYTGTGMNPARSFGTAFATDIWDDHWVYWAGPIAGAIVAAIIYTQILQKPMEVPRSMDASDKYRIHAYERELKKLESDKDFA